MSKFTAKLGSSARIVLVLALLVQAAGMRVASASNSVLWSLSHQFDASGCRPHVAFNGQQAVEVQQGGVSGTVPLSYRVGWLDPRTGSTILWDNSAQYDQGSAPSIAILGRTVVEVHQASDGGIGPLWYRVGYVGANSVSWGPSHQYDRGESPSIGFGLQRMIGKNVPTVVEIHQAGVGGTAPLRFRVGYVSGTTISFGKSYQYDKGSSPSVSFDGLNVLEVHDGAQNSSNFQLWYRGGSVSEKAIVWGSSYPYDTGAYPSNSLMSGQAIEVHESSFSGISALRFNAGLGPQGSGYIVNWYESGQYDQGGMNPSVSFYGSATAGGTFVEVDQSTTGLGPLFYQVGVVQVS